MAAPIETVETKITNYVYIQILGLVSLLLVPEVVSH